MASFTPTFPINGTLNSRNRQDPMRVSEAAILQRALTSVQSWREHDCSHI